MSRSESDKATYGSLYDTFAASFAARGTKPLFDSVDVTFNPGDKIGLIGSNGAGKSSLFAMLRRAASGSGQYRIPAKWQLAHVAQETPPLERRPLITRLMAMSLLRKLEAEWPNSKPRADEQTGWQWQKYMLRWRMPMPTPCAHAPNNY
jgi:ATPase subunit of ABC transporter with duplicated ATPase domains